MVHHPVPGRMETARTKHTAAVQPMPAHEVRFPLQHIRKERAEILYVENSSRFTGMIFRNVEENVSMMILQQDRNGNIPGTEQFTAKRRIRLILIILPVAAAGTQCISHEFPVMLNPKTIIIICNGIDQLYIIGLLSALPAGYTDSDHLGGRDAGSIQPTVVPEITALKDHMYQIWA